LNKHKEVKELYFCLDNDPAGLEAAINLLRKYHGKGYFAVIEPPQGKDFNEDLQALTAQKRAEKSTIFQRRDVDI